MSGFFGPKLVILVVILAILGMGLYISHLTQQTSEANAAVEPSLGQRADLVAVAIRETESSMSNSTKRR